MGRLHSLKDASRRAAWWSSTSTGLAWLFLAGLVVRLVLARGGGFPFDMGTFAAWADRLATGGLHAFYPKDEAGLASYFVDYPPGYMYVLFVVGKISRALTGAAPSTFLLKVPAILTDLGLAWVVVVLAQRLTPRSLATRFPVRGIAAAAVLLNPAIFFVSGTWGQVDTILALLVLGSFALLGTGPPTARREAAGLAVLALALITKPQAAFVIPLAVVVLLWRHVRTPLAESQGTAAALAGLARVAGLGMVALGFILVLLLPFGLDLPYAMRFYTHAAGTYKFTSVWAFNLWGAVGFWRPDSGTDDAVRFLGVPAVTIGLALFTAGTVALLWRAWRSMARGEREGRVLIFGGAALTCLAFAVLTRIHERYLFLAIACLAPLVAYRVMRRTLVALSVLYLVNVYFAYVYYVEYVKRKAIRIPGYDLLYGTINDSAQRKTVSLATGVLCLVVAWRGWRWLESRSGAETADELASESLDEPGVVLPAAAAEVPPEGERPERPPKPPWTLRLHPVGRRGAAMAGVAFVLVAVTRFAGLGTPPGMYFDEVYHARTAGEYLQGKEVYEWTHPPLAKEMMALSIAVLGRTGVRGSGALPDGAVGSTASSDGLRAAWASRSGAGRGVVHTGDLPGDCALPAPGRRVPVALDPTVTAVVDGGAFVAGASPQGPALARVDGSRQLWSAVLPADAAQIAVVGRSAFVLTTGGHLVRVSDQGEASTLADDAGGVAAAKDDVEVWATFPGRQQVVAYGEDGAAKTTINVLGRPRAVVASTDADRVLVSDASSQRIESIDTEAKTRTDSLDGPSPDRFVEIPATGLVWAFDGRHGRVIEPRGLSVMGRLTLEAAPRALAADRAHNRILAVGSDAVSCAANRIPFAWRFGSALFGSLIAALVLLIALRLTGSALTGALAAFFVAVDGLAYVLSRIAMNDSYVTAFLLLAWFAALGCLYQRGARDDPEAGPGSRWAALGWLALAGVASGLAIASKWVGLYAMAGIALLFLWDLRSRGRAGVVGIAGPPAAGVAVVFAMMVLVPFGVYLASYAPYFSLGHTFAEFLRQTKGMYDYHAHLTATHPYGSPWYGWPIGRRAVWLYLGTDAGRRAEIWTVMNPIVAVGGAVGIGAVAVAAWRRRSIALAVIPLGALVQFLPWATVSRVTFLYHYLPDVPFLALGLAWWITLGRKGVKRQRLEIAAVAGAALAAFAFTLPVLDGWFVSSGYIDVVKAWLSWMF